MKLPRNTDYFCTIATDFLLIVLVYIFSFSSVGFAWNIAIFDVENSSFKKPEKVNNSF